MSTATKNSARLNFRLPSELKQLIEVAAAQLGQSVSEFAASSLAHCAHDVIQQHDRTVLSNRDREVFIAMLDDVDARPNKALAGAARKYREQVD